MYTFVVAYFCLRTMAKPEASGSWRSDRKPYWALIPEIKMIVLETKIPLVIVFSLHFYLALHSKCNLIEEGGCGHEETV